MMICLDLVVASDKALKIVIVGGIIAHGIAALQAGAVNHGLALLLASIAVMVVSFRKLN